MDAKNQRHVSEDLDRWLDLALRERANAEPRGGLEERVLARLATQPPKRLFAWWQVWAAAVAIFVIALTLSLIYSGHQDQVASKNPSTVLPEQSTKIPGLKPAQRPPTKEERAASGRNAACCVVRRMMAKNTGAIHATPENLPKLSAFPAPHPETAQERLLAQLAGQPQTAEISSFSDNGMPLKELSIPELKINPMEGTPPDDVQQEEFGRKDASKQRK